MRIIKGFFRNIVIFLFALVFALAILFLIKHPNLLQASVLNINEISTIQNNKWDIAYKQENNILDIFFAKHLNNEPISIVLLHSDSIVLDLAGISGQCPFTVVDANQDTTKVVISCPEFNPDESIFLLPFSGDMQDILVEEAYYSDSKESFSIGNLSLITSHSMPDNQ